MGPYRNTNILQDAMVFLNSSMVDRHARIVDDLMYHTGWIGLRGPFEIVYRFRPVTFSSGIDLVDSNDFTRLGFGEQILVVEAPPCRGVTTKRLAGVFRIGAGPRRISMICSSIISPLGAPDIDWSSEDMDAEAFACTATE